MPSLVPSTAMRQGDHSCYVYESSDDRLEVLIPFLDGARSRSERVAYVSDGDGRLARDLAQAGVGPEDSDVVLTLPPSRALPDATERADIAITAIADAEREAIRLGFAALRVVGNVSDDLAAEPGWSEYEKRANGFFSRSGSMSLCLYPAERRHQLGEVVGAHPLWATRGSGEDSTLVIEPLPFGNGVRISGELDGTTAGAFAIAALPALDDHADVILDLRGLEFIDAAGARMISRAARIIAPRRLFIMHASPHTRRVLSLLGIDAAPNAVMRRDELAAHH